MELGYPKWEIVMSESKEALLRSKAMIIIASKGGSNKVWKRVMKRFIKCIGGGI